jgi:hypothetical protein
VRFSAIGVRSNWPEGTGIPPDRKGAAAPQPTRCFPEPAFDVVFAGPVGVVGLAGTQIESIQEAINAIIPARLMALPPCLSQPASAPLIVISEFLEIDPFLQADRFVIADSLEDLLQPQARSGREYGNDRWM